MKRKHGTIAEKNERVWLFSELVFAEMIKEGHEFKAGDKVEIQIMRVGKWDHAQYGEIKVNETTLKEVKKNFDENVRGVRLAVDENHEPDHKALGWFEELVLKNDDQELFAKIELTKKGAEILTDGLYRYFSPEIYFSMKDEESGEIITNLLVGGAFTNRPFFKSMAPLMANEDAADLLPNGNEKSKVSQSLLFFNSSTMNKFLKLLGTFNDKEKISASEKEDLTKAFGELPEDDITDELTKMFNDTVAKFDEGGNDPEGDDPKDPKGEPQDPEGDPEGDDPKDPEGEPEPKGEGEPVRANEDGSITMTAAKFEELKTLQKEHAKLIRKARKDHLSKEIGKFQFSDTNTKGIVLPKSKDPIVNFALSLSEKQSEQFLKILGDLKSVSASEIGKTGADGKAKDPKESDAVEYLMKKGSFTKEEATEIYKESLAK